MFCIFLVAFSSLSVQYCINRIASWPHGWNAYPPTLYGLLCIRVPCRTTRVSKAPPIRCPGWYCILPCFPHSRCCCSPKSPMMKGRVDVTASPGFPGLRCSDLRVLAPYVNVLVQSFVDADDASLYMISRFPFIQLQLIQLIQLIVFLHQPRIKFVAHVPVLHKMLKYVSNCFRAAVFNAHLTAGMIGLIVP